VEGEVAVRRGMAAYRQSKEVVGSADSEAVVRDCGRNDSVLLN